MSAPSPPRGSAARATSAQRSCAACSSAFLSMSFLRSPLRPSSTLLPAIRLPFQHGRCCQAPLVHLPRIVRDHLSRLASDRGHLRVRTSGLEQEDHGRFSKAVEDKLLLSQRLHHFLGHLVLPRRLEAVRRPSLSRQSRSRRFLLFRRAILQPSQRKHDVVFAIDRLQRFTTLRVDRITHKRAGLRTFAADKSLLTR